jgi:(1->4)-alpha-D-glucan 1-alpha-D-glucosylmutase
MTTQDHANPKLGGFAATYRLQLTAEFPLAAAADLCDYLAALGISHLYCSPILQATPSSTHGYDVTDHQRISDELGGAEAFGKLAKRCNECGMQLLLDIVPNHMAATEGNRQWQDVLRGGRTSEFARWFDIDWEAPDPRLRGKIVLPFLGSHYGQALEAGELRLAIADAAVMLCYYDTRWPLSDQSLRDLLGRAGQGRLDDAARGNTDELRALQSVLDSVNADISQLHEIIAAQHYVPVHFRLAGSEINYRRFFEIDRLVGLRVEDQTVYEATHRLLLDCVRNAAVSGVRVDHPDGLWDPREYLRRLRRDLGDDKWLLVEKILARDEELPSDWPVDGTTGYDFIGICDGLFVDGRGEEAMTRTYQELSGEGDSYGDGVRAAKRQVLGESFGAELRTLTQLAVQSAAGEAAARDFAADDLRAVILELLADLPVYRLYSRGQLTEAEREHLRLARDAAKEQLPDWKWPVLDFVADLLAGLRGGPAGEVFAGRFAQLSGPAAAKGVEDTALYRYHRLVSLNEVGGEPGRFGSSPADFHQWCSRATSHRPRTLLAGSTHDTKRGEDTRWRIGLLSEIPDRWRSALERWLDMNRPHQRGDMPDANTLYLLYQTLVGAWPIDADRLASYMTKATREAKRHTAWIDPDAGYEQALEHYCRAILADETFTADFANFLAPLVEPARITSLAATLLRLTAPGVGDIYRGSELWNHSLVDPDNRRPVDYDLRRRLLEELDALSVPQILSRMDEGLPKLFVIRTALAVRRDRPDCFGPGAGYQPIEARGEKSPHLLAYGRGEAVVAAVPRLVLSRAGDWADTAISLPMGRWHNAFDGRRYRGGELPAGELLSKFPVALLTREESQ